MKIPQVIKLFIQQPLAHHNIDITTNIVDEAEEH